MKKLGTYFVLFLISTVLTAQNTAIDKVFDKYAGQEGFTTVYISKKLFDLAAEIEHEDEEVNDVVSKLESIRILAVDECDKPEGINFYDEVMQSLPKDEYEELLTVKEKNQDVIFLIKEKDGIISELLLLVGGEDNALISIQGDIDINQVYKLSHTIRGSHMDHLQKLKDKEL
ncbi:MAG: DUF4252 domain-containing protein [Bacteroidales bacterium]|nr:MAG: DUF4252 domain-containing protein [Bacteroidales bacterium]